VPRARATPRQRCERPLPRGRMFPSPRCDSAVVFPSPWWHRGPSLDRERPSRRPSVTVRGRASTCRLASRPSLFLRLCGDGQALDEELSAAQQRAPLPQTVQGSTVSAHTRFVVAPAAAVLLAFNLRRQAAPRAAIAEESRRKGHQHAPPQMCFAAAAAPWVDGRHQSPGNPPKQQQQGPRASQESKASPSRIARLFCLRSAGHTRPGGAAGAGRWRGRATAYAGPAQAVRIPEAVRTLWPSG
jgi:hypothetical protein